jgi:hypothetical protein
MWYKIGGIQINVDNFTFYKAVSLAQQEGYKRVFLDEGEGMRKLLYLVRSNQDAARYAFELLEAFSPISGSTPSPVQLLIGPLSEKSKY